MSSRCFHLTVGPEHRLGQRRFRKAVSPSFSRLLEERARDLDA